MINDAGKDGITTLSKGGSNILEKENRGQIGKKKHRRLASNVSFGSYRKKRWNGRVNEMIYPLSEGIWERWALFLRGEKKKDIVRSLAGAARTHRRERSIVGSNHARGAVRTKGGKNLGRGEYFQRVIRLPAAVFKNGGRAQNHEFTRWTGEGGLIVPRRTCNH